MAVRRGTGVWTRLSIGLQVAGSVGLAALAAGILTWLSARPGLWARVDLTAEGRQTVDAELAALLAKLPRPVVAEVFFRPPDPPLTAAGEEAQQRMLELLLVARNQFPENLSVRVHDLSDVAQAGPRMQELGLEEPNVIALRDGEHQAVLRLWRDLARLDPGNPATRTPPRLEAFLGDQALGNALLELGLDSTPVICFSTGQGERDLHGGELLDLGRLHAALVADGFEVRTWNAALAPELPEDCDVLAVVDPAQPLAAEALESMQRFASRGGRFLIVPSQRREALDGPGSMAAFLRAYGIEVQAGFVGRPVVSSLGQPTFGDPLCGELSIGPEGMDRHHPVTESLWSLERRVVLSNARAFRRGTAPENGVLLDVLRSPPSSWIDIPDAGGNLDWRPHPRLEESGSFILMLAAAFQAPEAPGEGQPDELGELGVEEQHVTRILAFGSPNAFGNGESGGARPIDTNRDLALNAFNWLASREHRLVIRPRQYVARLLDLAGGDQRALNRAALALPGLCLLAGLLVWWRRRR
jgi:hypothetical protein